MEEFGDQTFSFATILKESFSITKDRPPSSSVTVKTENPPVDGLVNETMFTDELEMPVSTGDFLNERQSFSVNTKTCSSMTVETNNVSVGDFVDQALSVADAPFSIEEDPLKRPQSSASVNKTTENAFFIQVEPFSTQKDLTSEHSRETRDTSTADDQGQPFSCTVKASSTLKRASVSFAGDQSSENQASVDDSEKTRDTSMADLEDLVVSYTCLLGDTASKFKDISDMLMADSEHTTPCSKDIDCSTEDETVSILKDISAKSQVAPGLNNDNDTSRSAKDFKQPPKKKIKLNKSVEIPVNDVLSGVHTRLCKHDCAFKHSPLVLAICSPNHYKLKKCLENHLKLAMKGAWKSAKYVQGDALKLQMHHYFLVHLAVLFGKYNLLEFLLKECLDHSELYMYVDSHQNSPFHTALKYMDHYMSSSSDDEKATTFQHMLQLLAKYNCNVLLVKDIDHGDTILHVCAKRIRKLTNQIQTLESLAYEKSKLEGLIEQRQLCEIIFSEMLHTFQKFCADGLLRHGQVIELFDCANDAGETMSQIIQEEESTRKNCRVHVSQVTSSMDVEEGNTECASRQEHCEDIITEESTSQLSTAKTLGTAQNGHAHVSTQAENPSRTTTLSTDCPSVQAPIGSTNRSTSTNVSASVGTRIPQTVLSTQAANPSGTTTLLTNCLSVQAPNGCPNQSATTTVSASVRIPQTVPSTQVANPSGTKTISTDCPSVQAPNGCPTQSASTTVSASVKMPQTVLSTQAANPSESTNCLSVQAPNGYPTQSASTTVSASVRMSTQVANPSGTTTISTDCPSVRQAHNGCPNQSASTTVSASVRMPQTVLSTQAANLSETTTLSTDCPSVQATNECRNQSVSTTVSAPVRTLFSPSKHTFLCSQGCSVKHHKLVQLLCATPDHLNIDSAKAETVSCENLRDYLKKNHLVINTTVPDHTPSLCHPIAHLACLLGKHKALEVLSEFGFHPLIHTTITEETPLHMTVRLLRHQTSSSVFLSDIVVSIVKTLNRHSHAISLFSAKDKKGNSVLHAMAELISSNVPEPAVLLYMYLFRVFVHFLLKGQQLAESVQILSSSLKDCNKAGEDVEFLLQKSISGEMLFEYLRGLMQRRVQGTSAGAHSKTSRSHKYGTNVEEAMSQEEGNDRTETQIQCASSSSHVNLQAARKDSCGHPEDQHVNMSADGEHDESMTEMGVHLMTDEPGSLVDFVLSADCKISSLAKKRIVECYIAEYNDRLQLIRAKLTPIEEESTSVGTLTQVKKKQASVHKQLCKVKSELDWHKHRMELASGEGRENRNKLLLLHDQLLLIDKLTKACW